jgi:CheY-like chemotaxis protein
VNAPRPGILVVDDTPSNIDVLKNMLVTEGYQVKAATSGEQALKVARKSPPPDLILLDVVMPVMDGYEVCRQLKADAFTSGIPVVFVTGAASDDEVQRGMLLGAAGFLFKPLEIALTLETVQSAIAKRGRR